MPWVAETLSEAVSAHDLKLAVLTDHDGIEGFEAFSRETSHLFPSVCASELSCSYVDPRTNSEEELHLLVYGIDPQDPFMSQEFARFRKAREERFFAICEKFQRAGYSLPADEFAKRHPGVLGRPHVADLLVEAGVVKSRGEAFDRFLKASHPFFVKKWRYPVEEMVAHCRRVGYRSSVAHPGQYQMTTDVLKSLREIGVDGIEVYHPRHSAEQIRYYTHCARHLGFMVTGGSDFHDAHSDQVESGPSLGRTSYALETAEIFLEPFL